MQHEIAPIHTVAGLASLTYELAAAGGAVPTEVHLLPVGPFRATDGRPFECEAWQLDAAVASRVISLAAGRQNDILIDFEHQSLRSEFNGQPAPAAGWIPRALEWREGSGLWATGITWVGDTAELIQAKRYRYVSTVFLYDMKTGEVIEVISAALTNTPGLDGLKPLAALARERADLSTLTTKKEPPMAGEKDQGVAALTQERDGLKNEVAALKQEREGLNTKVGALTQERDDARNKLADLERKQQEAHLEADKKTHADLLAAALSDGRLTPAQKPWAEKQSLAALTEFLDVSKPLAMLTKQTHGKPEAGGHGLSESELAMCTRMGVKPEDYAETRDKAAA